MAGTTSIRVAKPTADTLRRLAFTLSAQTGQRVTIGAALDVALAVAADHMPAMLAALTDGNQE